MDFKSMLQQLSQLSEATEETPTGKIHKAGPGGYGRKFDTDEEGDEKKDDKKKAEPAVKRGRGRPKKGADSETGQVAKYANAPALQSFMVGNLPKGKLPGKPGKKHSIKEWIEEVEAKYVAEASPGQQLTVKPMPGAAQLVDPASNKVMATGDAAAVKNIQGAVAQGKVQMRGAQEEMTEGGQDYSAKKARAGKDIGKPGKQFAKIAKGAAERYGSEESGERVAGAVLKNLRSVKKEGVAEGSILKSIRRGLQGWGGGVTPAGIKKRSSEYSDDELRSMSAGHDELRRVRASTPMPTEVPKHSPAGLQKRVLDREMKKRGLGEEGVAEGKQHLAELKVSEVNGVEKIFADTPQLIPIWNKYKHLDTGGGENVIKNIRQAFPSMSDKEVKELAYEFHADHDPWYRGGYGAVEAAFTIKRHLEQQKQQTAQAPQRANQIMRQAQQNLGSMYEQGVAEGIVDDMPADSMVGTMDKIRGDAKSQRYHYLQKLLKQSKNPKTIAQIKALLTKELKQGVAEGSLDEVSLDLAKQARDKAEYYVDMDYDDMRDRPYGYSEKQRSKFQRYIDKKEPRAKGDRDWDPPKKGVAEGSSDDLVYISVDRVEAFEDWMDSEGLETNVPKTDEGTYVVYDYSNADYRSKMYASDWNEKEGVAEAEIPSSQVDMGAGLGAGRSKTTFEGRKPDFLDLDKDKNKKESMSAAAKDAKKKKKMNESSHRHSSARLLGKAHALAKEAYNCKYDDLDEVRMYHEGYKEGLDECYGQGVYEMAPPATVPGMASAAMSMPSMEEDMFDEGFMDSVKGMFGKKPATAPSTGQQSSRTRLPDSPFELDDYPFPKGPAAKLPPGYIPPKSPHQGEPSTAFRGPMMPDSRQVKADADLMDYTLAREGNKFTGALKDTPKGGKFSLGGKSFTDTSDLDEMSLAFESLDKQLKSLLESEEVNEGMTVSISKGQQGMPDAVTVSAQDGEADALLSIIKQAGLGLFGDDQQNGYGVPDGSDAAHSHGDIKVVGDHDGMMSIMKKLAGTEQQGSEDYADEEDHDHGHENQGETCEACGESDCQCEDQMVDEVENYDQEGEEVAEDNPPDSGAAETTADENAEASEDMALANSDEKSDTITTNEGGDGGEASEEEEEQVTEWANDAGEKAKDFDDESFVTDMDFMTRVISGGLNKPKSTGQTTVPVVASQHDRMVTHESIADWKKLAGL